ncbi:sensor histidine kinase [Bradyrhizobium sp.]|uniref:sensor histidine kinase n=1 Tax=Bradyrhizobium sp. TaxID=376 RepID=UPI003C5DDEC2
MGPRTTLPETIAEVFITDELQRRATSDPDYLREKLALQDLAQQMSDHPSQVLPRLVKLAMDICDAESAGISILEPQSEQFRWFALSGVLASFEGATTPRNNSPCGVCLDCDSPVLMAHPERAYDWIRDAAISVPEVLLVPLRVKGLQSVGTLWIVASQSGHFDAGHARIMTELAAFAGMALRMIQTEERLTQALQQQETLAREMSHRVKNMFAITDSMIRMSSRSAGTKDELASTLSGRLHALASANALVRRSFGDGSDEGVNLHELIERVLRPHNHAKFSIDGPGLSLGEQATNNLALVFHELATNAAKYGALSKDSGSVAVRWLADDTNVHLSWLESGGPLTVPPATLGFGSRLVATTVERIGGKITPDWRPQGLSVQIELPLSALRP